MLEVLQDFPSARPPLAWLLQTVPRLRPRLFSISSSPAAHPATAHITAAIVDWATPFKRRRKVPAAPALPPLSSYSTCLRRANSHAIQTSRAKRICVREAQLLWHCLHVPARWR